MPPKKRESSEAIIIIAGKQVPYRVRVSTRARRLRLTVSNGQVSVTLPRGVPRSEAEKMLLQHSGWLMGQLERAARAKAPARALPADVILLRGEVKKMVVREESDRQTRLRVEEGADRVVIHAPEGMGKAGRSLAMPWLKARAREEITAATAKWAARMGLSYRAISIRDQKTRWGSCSSRGTLSFNWRLVMAPPAIMEYVVIHELAHLKQPDHSKAFWQLTGQFFPDYKKARAWLRSNASLLRPEDLA